VHVLFLTDNFPPETNAPASRTFEHVQRWVRAGHAVTVVTGAPNFPTGRVFPGYRNALYAREERDGVRVIRVWTYVTANEGFVRRTLDYLSFAVAGALAGLCVRRPDVVIGTSPQFFTVCGALAVAWLRRAPFVFELRDLWPDSITAVGAMRESGAIRLLRRLEYFLYRRAARIVSVTWSFREILARGGVPEAKVAVVPNGVDLALYAPGPKPEPLVARHGLAGRFVAAYVGTLGMAHGLGALLEAAERLKDDPGIAILLVGTGAERAALEERARQRGLGNVVFVGSVGKDEVRDYWRLCDAALVLLRDAPMFRHVIPSKMFEAMGSGRPIVLGVRGESAEILERAGAGLAVAPESPAEIAAALRRLRGDPALCAELGRRGRAFVEREFDRDVLAARMLAVLEDVVAERRAAPREAPPAG
jgi:hypothetical protein